MGGGDVGAGLGRTHGVGVFSLRIVAVRLPLQCDKYWVRWGAADGVMWFMCCRMIFFVFKSSSVFRYFNVATLSVIGFCYGDLFMHWKTSIYFTVEFVLKS